MIAIEVAALTLLAVAMAVSLSHALEFAGRRRLDRATYLALQSACYSGFTLGGLAEALAVVAVLAFLLATPPADPAFLWATAAMAGLFGMNVCYWLMTRSAPRLWLSPKAQAAALGGAADGGGPWSRRTGPDWRRLRDRWEYSHAARALLALLSLGSLTAAIALGPTH